MIELIKSIPSTIWAVIFGSVITLFGVLVSNINNNKRHATQLRHDSLEKTKDRKSAIRHQVYLLATEELVKANHYLGSLSQVDITKTNIAAPLEGFFVAASKLSMIADQETGHAVDKLISIYGKLIFRLMAKIMPMQDTKTDIQIIDENYNNTKLEIERILSEMKRYNESLEFDIRKFSVLEQSFDFQQKAAKKLTKERGQLSDKLDNLNLEYTKSLMNEMKEAYELQIPVLVGIRKELELKTDEEEYRKNLVQQRKEITEQMEEFLNSLESKA
ncbi:MAG: PCRF domain-containing protein [Desulfobacteraceae bacterium]|nr:PCRF domain-containing protein [Desulfobacteraceae bacterium]